MYYLTHTAKRKNAKRHIAQKSKDLETLRKVAKNWSDRYIAEIYNGKWELVERLKG